MYADKQTRLKFSLSIKTGGGVAPNDWMVHQAEQTELREKRFDLRADVNTLFRIAWYAFTKLPVEIVHSPMPAGVPNLMPVVVRFFAGEIWRHSVGYIDEWYRSVANSKFVRSAGEVLKAKYYWTDWNVNTPLQHRRLAGITRGRNLGCSPDCLGTFGLEMPRC